MDEKKQEIKKFLHDYSVAIVTTIFLIIVLLILVVARHNGLVSIKDLSKINPLITSEQNTLVASNDSNGIIKIPKDDESQDTDKTTEEPGKTTGSDIKTGGTTGGGTGSGNNSGTGGSGGTGSNPPDTPQPFSASIAAGSIRGSMNSQCSLVGVLGGCIGSYTYTYTLTATINGQNGPGTVPYTWSADPTSGQTVNSSSSLQAGSGSTTNVITTHWSTNKCTPYDVTLTVTGPSNSQQSISTVYSPSC